MWLLASRLVTVVEEGKPTHVKPVRPFSCSSSVTVFANVFQRCCVAEEWSREWSCAKLVGRTMGLCKMDVTRPPVKGSIRKYSDRGQLPTVSENESEKVLGDCLLELDEMSLEVALSAIIGKHLGQSSSSDDLPNEADPDLDALHSDAEVAKPLETIASYVDWQCAAPDPAVESRSEESLLWANAADRKCTLLIDAKELASRPLGPIRVRECTMALLLTYGCRAEHERPDRLYVHSVHWANAQRTKGKYMCLDNKNAGTFSAPCRHTDQELSKHMVLQPRRGHPHDQTRALEAAQHCPRAVAHVDSNVGHHGFGC